jgi:hypothetical protein
LLVNSELLKEPNELRCVAEMHRWTNSMWFTLTGFVQTKF